MTAAPAAAPAADIAAATAAIAAAAATKATVMAAPTASHSHAQAARLHVLLNAKITISKQQALALQKKTRNRLAVLVFFFCADMK
ncbi:hypothetical protein D3C86_1760650 [compost metagenome]